MFLTGYHGHMITHTLLKKIAEMTITIEDLESLKELNDELEENHMETEKQLQEEIGLSISIKSLARQCS